MQSDLETAVCYNHSERLLLSESLEESAAMQVADTAGTYPNLRGSPLTLQRRRGWQRRRRRRRRWNVIVVSGDRPSATSSSCAFMFSPLTPGKWPPSWKKKTEKKRLKCHHGHIRWPLAAVTTPPMRSNPITRGVFESKQSYTKYSSNTTEIWSRSGHFCCFIVNNVILMRSGFDPIAFGPSVNTCDNTTVPDKRKWSD